MNVLRPDEVAQRLHGAGLPVAEGVLVSGVDAIPEAFEALAADAVVLKAAGVLHKTDVGGVVTHLHSAHEVVRAAVRMLRTIGDAALPLLVQRQEQGIEMLVGLRRDPQLGCAVVVGLGGVHSEIHQDTSRRLAPVDPAEAHAMLRELRSWPLLEGYRGVPPYDVEALCDVVVRAAAIGTGDPTVMELDLNPVMVGRAGHGCVVVDARIVTGPVRDRGERAAPYDLDRMLNPRHVAVVGVSDDPSKTGSRVFRNLVQQGFAGRLDAVHPAGGEVDGRTRYAALDAIDGSPDLVCVAVPEPAVLEVARQAVAAGVGGVIIHSSGFASTGASGQALQDAVHAVLSEGGVPLLGPNSMGVIAPRLGVVASTSRALDANRFTAGNVGLLSSSGALGGCVASRLDDVAGLSHWAHVGNEAGLTLADLLAWLASDDETGVAALLVEDIKDGAALVDAGRLMAAAGKPVIGFDLVRSDRAREAAMSHTGAMVGSLELRKDVLRAAGVAVAPSLRAFEDAIALASRYGIPAGDRLLAFTFSGGACTIIADEVVDTGIVLPELPEAVRLEVETMLPAYGAASNPMDAGFMADAHFGRLFELLITCGAFDAVLIQFTTNADPMASRYARTLVEIQAATDVPIYVSRYGHHRLAPDAMEIYRRARVPVLDAPDRAVQAVATVMRARRAVARARDPQTPAGPLVPAIRTSPVAEQGAPAWTSA